MSVDYFNTEYAKEIPNWKLMSDSMSSETHIHDCGTTYLPILDDMTESQYLAYTKRANYPMYTKHAMSTFVGMALRKELLLQGVPEDLNNNIDEAGCTLTAYTKELLDEFITYGRCMTLVEYSTGNSRAKLLLYNHLSIINWKTRIIDDVDTLCLVVIRENVNIAEDEYGTEIRYRYRVLSLDAETNIYRQRVYDDELTLLTDIVPTKNRKPLTFIPAVIHGGIDVKEPPLLSLAEQNMSWYRLDADYKHGLHYVALPTPCLIGVDPEDKHAPTSIGSTKLWFLPDGADAKYLEFSGKGLGQIKDAKDEIAENIITLSSRILSTSGSVNETATAATIRNAGETASLADIVNMLSRELTLALEIMINWDRITTDDVSVAINTDFVPTILSGGDVASYVASMLKGGLSPESLYNVLKRGEIIQGDRTLEEEIAAITKYLKQEDARQVQLTKDMAEAEASAAPVEDNPNPVNEDEDPDPSIKQGTDDAKKPQPQEKAQ